MSTKLQQMTKLFKVATDPADPDGIMDELKFRSVLRDMGLTTEENDNLLAQYDPEYGPREEEDGEYDIDYKKFLSWVLAPAASEMIVLYSSRTPDKETFANCVGCPKQEYNWQTAGARELIAMLREAKSKTPGGLGFENICFACHGPIGESDAFCWEITKSVVLSKVSQLDDPTDPVTQVVTELARCTKDGGRVDLLACSMLKSEEGQRAFAAIEANTKTNFAASCDVTGNTKDGGNWIMESDGVDISSLYFRKIDKYSGTFAVRRSRSGKPAGRKKR